MQFKNFDQKVKSFSLIRIFTDYYLANSKTNAIPTKANIPYWIQNSQIYKGYLANKCKINEMTKCILGKKRNAAYKD